MRRHQRNPGWRATSAAWPPSSQRSTCASACGSMVKRTTRKYRASFMSCLLVLCPLAEVVGRGEYKQERGAEGEREVNADRGAAEADRDAAEGAGAERRHGEQADHPAAHLGRGVHLHQGLRHGEE